MRFEEAYGGWEAGRLTQAEASSLLGVCERTFRRYLMRYEADGLEGLLDRRLEQVSHRKAPVDEVMDLLSTYRRRHEGWNAKHAVPRFACSSSPMLRCSHFDVTAKPMPNLTLRDVPADLHLWLKQQAGAHRRSLNQEVILQLDALRSLPASRSDADLRLARIRAIAARASSARAR
jgi:hypothetical protein